MNGVHGQPFRANDVPLSLSLANVQHPFGPVLESERLCEAQGVEARGGASFEDVDRTGRREAGGACGEGSGERVEEG